MPSYDALNNFVNGIDCELTTAQELLRKSADFLENATVTTDALHTPKKTNCLINDLGGENFSTIKKNQEDYYKYAGQLLKDRAVDQVGELDQERTTRRDPI